MRSRAAFVYHASSVDTIGRIPCKCYFQQWWTRYSSIIAIFIQHLHWTPPLILIVYSRLDIGIQSPTVRRRRCCHPLIKGATVLHSFNCQPPYGWFVSCWSSCSFYSFHSYNRCKLSHAKVTVKFVVRRLRKRNVDVSLKWIAQKCTECIATWTIGHVCTLVAPAIHVGHNDQRERILNPLDSKGNYSATSNNTKLVHWPLMGGLLHLVQRGGAWTGCGPPSPPRRFLDTKSPLYTQFRQKTPPFVFLYNS